MANTIHKFFQKEAPQLDPSTNLTKQLKHFRLEWSTKNDNYIDFLGSKLLGSHVIRFSAIDEDKLMEGVLRMDDWRSIQDRIYSIGINKKFKVASNIIYQTLSYLVYRYTNDKSLSAKDKQAGIRELCLIMQYRMFTSLYFKYFPYQVPEAIAITVYNKLSHKFLIKQLDSWQAVFEYRINSCTDSKNSIYKRYKTYSVKDSIDNIAGIQGSVRAIVKYYYKVLIKVNEEGEILSQESSTYVGGENNEKQVRDITRGTGRYIHKMQDISRSSRDFIDRDSIKIIAGIFTASDEDLIYKVLKCLSSNKHIEYEKSNEIVEKSLLISFGYLQRIGINIEDRENIPKALIAVRYYWSGSRVQNEDMEEIKEFLRKYVKTCSGRNTAWVNNALVLIYNVYLFLRSIKE